MILLDDGTYRANSQLYRLKIALADALKAEQSRPSVPWIETDTETAYGSTQRISRSIRVF